MTEIADRVFAYVQPDGGWCLNNSGALVGGNGVVAIDTVATIGRARRLREHIDQLGAGPVRTVVNTHHHGDHVFGNCVFSPDATVIAHERTKTEMLEAGLGLTRLWPDVDWGEVNLVPPDVTFADRLTLHQDDRTVELIHVGPAHTTNDVVAWLPKERVLFAGDVVLAGCSPFVLMGSVSGSLDAISLLRSLDPVTVVSGHGPIGGPEVFDANERYLRWIQRLAAAGFSAGISPLELARQSDLAPAEGLLDQERIVGNLHRAYSELRGQPRDAKLDVVGIFGEMVQFNSGVLPTCLA